MSRKTITLFYRKPKWSLTWTWLITFQIKRNRPMFCRYGSNGGGFWRIGPFEIHRQAAMRPLTYPRPGYPKQNQSEALAAVQNDKCPKCGGDLDTGWECTNCREDYRSLVA